MILTRCMPMHHTLNCWGKLTYVIHIVGDIVVADDTSSSNPTCSDVSY